jgi:hypothetical protein
MEVIDCAGPGSMAACTNFGVLHIRIPGVQALMQKTNTYVGYSPKFSVMDTLFKVPFFNCRCN